MAGFNYDTKQCRNHKYSKGGFELLQLTNIGVKNFKGKKGPV
jgi:hypothetical protein